MAYTKTNNSQTDVDENEMIHIDMGRKNSSIPQLVDEASIASGKLVSASTDEYKLTLKEGRCDDCIHLKVCKYKNRLDNFKTELEDVYEDTEGSKFMNVDLSFYCGYRRKE